MQLETFDGIDGRYGAVVLSPHLDDAALSCGALIANRTAARQPTLVVTFCSAAPDPASQFNTIAREFHAEWNLAPDEVVAARLREDAAAMAALGADYCYAGMTDAIYRAPESYVDRSTLYATPVPDDPLFAEVRRLLRLLLDRAPHATIYAPLAVGDHVDHRVTFAEVLAADHPRAVFYEDINYALIPGAVEARLAAIGRPMVPATADVTAGMDAKIAAIRAYASQQVALFGDPADMPRQIRDYAAGLLPGGYGERVWRLS